jgi:hypothetical protein
LFGETFDLLDDDQIAKFRLFAESNSADITNEIAAAATQDIIECLHFVSMLKMELSETLQNLPPEFHVQVRLVANLATVTGLAIGRQQAREMAGTTAGRHKGAKARKAKAPDILRLAQADIAAHPVTNKADCVRRLVKKLQDATGSQYKRGYIANRIAPLFEADPNKPRRTRPKI